MSSLVEYQSLDSLSFNPAGIAYDYKVGKDLQGITMRFRNETNAEDFENKIRTLLVPSPKEMGIEGIQASG